MSYPANVNEIHYVSCYFEEPSSSMRSTIKNLCIDDMNTTEIFDFTSSQDLDSGVFTFRRCANYHCLSNLKSLEIRYCDSITDVSCFQNIPKLRLHQCINIVDVSSLGRVTDLSLEFIDRITDVSALGKVRTLCLRGCFGIRDISPLSNV
jgi:hypothetical protein